MNTKIIPVLVFLLAAGMAGFFIYQDNLPASEPPAELAGETSNTNTEDRAAHSDGDVSVEIEEGGDGAFVVKPDIDVPDLDYPLVFPASMSEEERTRVGDNIESDRAFLRENPNHFEMWIQLGLRLKNIGDLDGARAAWEYASAIRPKNSLSFDNLANLYGYYYKDTAKAEENFQQAIANDPGLTYLYARAAIYYKDIAGDLERAIAYIELGLKNNPQDGDLKAALAELESLREGS